MQRLTKQTTPNDHSTPPSVLSIIYPDGRPEALIAANNFTDNTQHAVGYGRCTCRNRIRWLAPQYDVRHSAHTHHLFLDCICKRQMHFFSHLNARQPSAPPACHRDTWAYGHYVHSTVCAVGKEHSLPTCTCYVGCSALCSKQEMKQARCRKQPFDSKDL
jgi:hypothetical protein